MVVDVVTFNGEQELWDLRYKILKNVVDEFIVIEFDETFSGKPKEPSFKYQYLEKVKYYFVTDWSKYLEMARQSPNTQGADHWKQEFAQKECIKDCLGHLKDDDVVFIGDCDEIYDPEVAKITPEQPLKLGLRVYTYWLNNRSSEQFWGTIMVKYGDIKDKCLNHIRSTDHKKVGIEGWHFTSLKDGLKKKLEDSYTKETYANDWVISNLENNINNSRDFLGRDFKYCKDESEWPEYLKKNKSKWTHLLL